MLAIDNNVFYTSKEPPGETDIDSISYATPPKCDVSDKSGASLAMQYLESFKYRTSKLCQCIQANIDSLYQASKVESLPTLKNLMQNLISLNYAKNCNVAFFNDFNSMLYYLYQYKSAVVELKLTTTTKNAHAFEILSEGETLSDSIAKGFIIYKATPEYVILQNTLGEKCGAYGFNMVKIELFKKLFIDGASLTVKEEV